MNTSNVLVSDVELTEDRIFFHHNKIQPGKPTVLFIHGLGESGLCFMEAFHHRLLNDFNIVIPDLPGFGKSAHFMTEDFSFVAQSRRIHELVDKLNYSAFHLIGHSMGGDIGTLFCSDFPRRVKSFVNIEGDLTSDDCFITNQAIEAERHARFDSWFQEEFSSQQVQEWSKRWPSCLRYATSLALCSSQAFIQSAYEIYRLNKAIDGRSYGRIAESLLNLATPNIFCWGVNSLSSSSRKFLSESKIKHQTFDSFHWVMLDQPDLFYSFLAGYLAAQY